uniref:Cysteine and histidine rich 1 n=1 Tax=Rousettus aegyptiacus TaxID=9407 RepID=A0A7J8C1B7_ROUAE|nr:cysteine and histidine rich 1 [Rousettus aegyptiacus]
MCPPDQDGQRADGDPGRDGPEPPQGDAVVQQHLQPAQLREDRLHSACGRVDSRGRARARSRPKEQQGAPADAGAAQGGSGPRLPSPRQVAS